MSSSGSPPGPPLRVLAVLPGVDSDGGAEVSFVAAVGGLQRAGITVHLAVLSERHGLVPDLERRGVVVHDLSGPGGFASQVRSLRRVIRATRPDVVHASLFEAAAPTQVAALRSGIPVLVTWANVNYGEARAAEPGTSRWKLAAHQWVEATLGRISGSWYHAVTPAVGRLNAAALRLPGGRVLVGERGRDPQRFPCVEHRELATGRPPVLLAVGRQDHQKGYDELLRAFDVVADRHPGATLRIAGRDGSGTASLHRVLQQMHHPAAVELLGQRNDIAGLMADADMVVCTSWREGAAGSLIEAMASCVPIAAVEVPGLEELLVDGRTATVEPRGRLADAVERVLVDPTRAQALAVAAREVFERRYTLDAAAQRLAEIYRTVSQS